MLRRDFTSSAWCAAFLGQLPGIGWAAEITETDAASGVRAALERGAAAAVSRLGKTDGFLANPKVRIPLPGFLADAGKLLKATGQQKRVDELIASMNRAAEAAVPQAKPLLVSAVRSMSVEDARHIVGGGVNSVTQFFASKTREPLGVKFLPIVARATERVALADKYNALASRASRIALIKKEDANAALRTSRRCSDRCDEILRIHARRRRVPQPMSLKNPLPPAAVLADALREVTASAR